MAKAVLSSMTGFARVNGAHEDRRWVWEVKSVNGRGLEFRFRMPNGFDALELSLRKAAKAVLHRGSLNISLSMRRDAGEAATRVNEEALAKAIAIAGELVKQGVADPPRADGLLALRGVLEIADDPDEDEAARAPLMTALLASFEEALAGLAEARAKEGEALHEIIAGQLDEVERLAAEARTLAEAAPEALRARLSTQIEALLSGAGLSEERLAQEAALLAVKADVAEELDRFTAHLAAGRELLAKGGAAGRPLDFLTQELNREANTLCSKAPDMALKQVGLALKNVIDKMREQVQNIE